MASTVLTIFFRFVYGEKHNTALKIVFLRSLELRNSSKTNASNIRVAIMAKVALQAYTFPSVKVGHLIKGNHSHIEPLSPSPGFWEDALIKWQIGTLVVPLIEVVFSQ